MVYENYGHGGDIYRNRVAYDFSANTGPLGTPEPVCRAVRKAASCLQSYPDPYCGALRRRLGELLDCGAEDIICGCGAAELLFHFALALRPRNALLPVPTFSEYEMALRAVGCAVTFFPMGREEGFELTEAVLEPIVPGLDLLILCNPNNPTGLPIGWELLERIVGRCRDAGVWLLLDECFLDLTDEEAAFSPLSGLREGDRVFLLRAFTKLYGMAGLRLGYGLCRDRALLEAMCRVQQPWNVSTPAQAGGLAALDCCADFAVRTRELVGRERRFLEKELTALGIPFLPGRANFLLLWGGEDWGRRLLEGGILIRDCADFRGLSPGAYRIAVRTREENLVLLAALTELVEA